MKATASKDEAPTREDAPKARLRVEVYEALAASMGHKTVVSQARWHGVARSVMFRLRAGGAPSMDTALRIATDLGVALDAIWDWDAA